MLNVAIFLDLPNLHFNLRTHWPDGRLSYSAYLERAKGADNLIRAIAYGAQLRENDTGFLAALRLAGWETKYKRPVSIKTREGNTIKRISWNVEITCDMLTIEPKVQKIILGCGNSDLVQPVRMLQARGIYVEVLAANIGTRLRSVCNRYYELTEDLLVPQDSIVPEAREDVEGVQDLEASEESE